MRSNSIIWGKQTTNTFQLEKPFERTIIVASVNDKLLEKVKSNTENNAETSPSIWSVANNSCIVFSVHLTSTRYSELSQAFKNLLKTHKLPQGKIAVLKEEFFPINKEMKYILGERN